MEGRRQDFPGKGGGCSHKKLFMNFNNNFAYRTRVVVLARQNYQVKEYEMGRACSTNGEKRNSYRILVGKPE
jgi:hypothetical protein